MRGQELQPGTRELLPLQVYSQFFCFLQSASEGEAGGVSPVVLGIILVGIQSYVIFNIVLYSL